MKKLAFLLLLCCCVRPAFASKALGGWELSIAPYLWAMNLNGDVQIGSLSAPVSEPFSKLIENFRGGGMVWLDLNKNRFGIFVNGLYVTLENTTSVGGSNIKMTSDYGLLSAGVTYRLTQTIEPYIGARYTSTQTGINVANTSISIANNETWTDPIIGTRLNFYSRAHWSLILAGDVGGINFNDHKSYDLNAFLGYNPSVKSKIFTLYLGYKLLYQHYVSGTGASRFAWKMHLSGPLLGFALRF